jgi:2-keto-3-deoxy-L-fuconate dehydrogenase
VVRPRAPDLTFAHRSSAATVTRAGGGGGFDRIRVNCVHPGTVDSPWISRLLDAARNPDDELAALRARQPIGRLVTTAEVAHAIVYLADPAAGSVTGTEVAVDGGMAGLRCAR